MNTPFRQALHSNEEPVLRLNGTNKLQKALYIVNKSVSST